jgi:hypothetical protein
MRQKIRVTWISIAALGGGLAILGAAASAAYAGSTIAWYRFNTGPNGAQVESALDSGPYGLDGSVTGDEYYSNVLPPQKGEHFSLDATAGDDYDTVPDNSVLDQTGSFQLSAWAYPTGGTNSQNAGDAIATKTITTEGNCIISYGIYYNATTGLFSAATCSSSNVNDAETVVYSSDTYPLDGWHFVELQYKFSSKRQTGTLSLYVDGTLEGSQANVAPIYHANAPFYIGAENACCGYSRNFIGYIDDVRLKQ